MTSMTAAVLTRFGADVELTSRPVPQPGPGEALVAVRAAGLCGTDLHMQDGRVAAVRLPHVPGHETAGQVVALGEGATGVRVGDAVVVGLDIACGRCRFCLTGRANLCLNLTRLGFERDGGLQQFMAAPAANLIPFDATRMSYAKAAVIPDAVACMYHAIRGPGRVRALDRVCVMGLGGLGFQGLQIAKLFGADVTCTSRQSAKLALASAMGADHVIDTATDDLPSAIADVTGGELCDVVFDCIGSTTSVQRGLDACRRGGRVVVVGYCDERYDVDFQTMVLAEKQIVGVRGSNRRDLEQCVNLVQIGAIDPYVSDTFALAGVNQALHRLRDGLSMGRTVVTMPDD